MKKLKSLLAALVAVALTSACGPYVDDNPEANQGGQVSSFAVLAEQLVDGKAVLLVGEKMQLKVQVNPLNGVATIVFMSSDEAVATVTQSGLIECVGPGDVQIFAWPDTNPDLIKVVTLTVTDDKVPIDEGEKAYQEEAEARKR